MGSVAQGVVIGVLPFGLSFVESFFNQLSVTLIFASACFIQAADSVNLGFQSLFFLRVAMFDTLLESIVEMGVELIA